MFVQRQVGVECECTRIFEPLVVVVKANLPTIVRERADLARLLPSKGTAWEAF